MTDLLKIKPVYVERQWTEKEQNLANKLMEDGNIPPLLAYLYVLRGIETAYEASANANLEPFMNMLGMSDAAKMLADAILEKKRMCIVADYDVDGATACAIGIRGLKMFGADIDFFVPNRFKHGYGLQPSVVDEAILKNNPEIIITVDNGIASIEGVAYANKKGIRVLVTDHHLQTDELPDAEVIVNPNQKACQFKNKSLAGCGVMFYVLCALRQEMVNRGVYTRQTAPNVFELIDLVALGTIADVVKLEHNNRILVEMGLKYIRKGKAKPGINALLEVAGKNIEKTCTADFGFAVGPRLNAAGRLEDMSIGIACLLTDDYTEAQKMAADLNETNINRRAIETEMKDFALGLDSLMKSKYSKVAYGDDFHEGVVGIVASRIKDMFFRPSIVFAPAMEEGLIKGSGRSIPGVNLRDALDTVYKRKPHIIHKFGGHAMAAGITIHKEYLEEFCEELDKSIYEIIGDEEISNEKKLDFELPGHEINLENANILLDGIWGQGFPPPLFFGEFKILSQNILKGNHLKFLLEKDGQEIEAMWFNTADLIESEYATFVYTISINDFRGRQKVQLLIDGIKE